MVDSVLLVEGVGILAGVLGLIAWMPQTFQIWVNKKIDIENSVLLVYK